MPSFVFLLINFPTFHQNQINQYCTGLKCVSYSVTQVKTQLNESLAQRPNENSGRSNSGYTVLAFLERRDMSAVQGDQMFLL